MPAFEYSGLDKSGKEVKGVRDADNERALRAALKRDGIFLTRVGKGPKKGQSLLSTEVDLGRYFERITPSDISIFTRQLATLVRAGIPLVDAISATVDQTEKPKLRKILAKIRQDVSEGMSLAQALTQHPDTFGAIFSNMVRAGEASGTLDQVLIRLAEFTEAAVKLRQKIQSAMMYPVIMVGIGGLILTGLFVYVIPQITQIFEDSGQELPFITRLLIGFSHILRDYWWLAILLTIGGVYGFRKWKKTDKGRYSWDRRRLSFPVFGKLGLMIGVSRFTKTLSTLLRSGVPLLTALDITKNVLENEVLMEVVDAARGAVKEGASLADPLKQSGRFPPIVTHMIAIGERSGALEDMLNVVAEAYETEVENRVASLTSLLEPLMIVGMGVTIAIIVFAVLMPILQLNEFVQ
ncbi:MAG: type II secretion system inner membrane protein GspF [Myxococcales bacterium]|nr:type II secretion system inner membrane protein GspF [Myxococcales bacterium]MCB9538416.1 type II secretion system inner membrane protein GspF [Myxococcales bacterium]